MYFEYPYLLWLLIVPALLAVKYVYDELRDRRPHFRVSVRAPWMAGGSTVLDKVRHIPFIFRIAALCLIIVALARPRSSTKVEKIDTEGIDIAIAMDVSTSMLARDFTPDRISAAKDIAIEFIAQRPSDRMSIVVFAGESYTQCPLTTDRATLINLMKEVSTDLIEDGTAIGNGLATAVARLKDSDARSRVIILRDQRRQGLSGAGDQARGRVGAALPGDDEQIRQNLDLFAQMVGAHRVFAGHRPGLHRANPRLQRGRGARRRARQPRFVR